MVTIVTMETKYTALLSQLNHIIYLPDLSLSWVFQSTPSVLPSSIVFIIIVCYLRIIIMKKLMNLDCLTCYCHYTCFVSIDSLSVRAELTFDSICTVCKSFSKIL